MMRVCDFSFDEYGELCGVSVLNCGKDYDKEKNEWLDEYYEKDEDERYDELVELDDGWMINYGWGNVSVSLEINDNVEYVYLMMDECSEVDGYWYGDERMEGYEEYGDKGVYYKEVEGEEYDRRSYDLMISVKELKNYNMRDVGNLFE